MDVSLSIFGIAFVILGAALLAFARIFPEPKRRERRRARNLVHRAREAGLRGRYQFTKGPAQWGSVGAFGTYVPVDDEDRELYTVVGPRIESEAAFFAGEMLWTDARLAWIGIPLILIGVATIVIALYS